MMELTKNQNLDIVLDEATRTIIIDSYERHFLEYVKLIWPKAAESLGESLQIEFEKETKLKKSSKKAIKTKLKVIIWMDRFREYQVGINLDFIL